MHHFLARIFCCIAAITLMEVPSAVLQTYAWVTMLHDRIPQQGISEALLTTFDDEHPCDHCLFVRALQKDRDRSQNSLPSDHFSFGNLKHTGLKKEAIVVRNYLPHRLILLESNHYLRPLEFQVLVPTPPPRLA